MVWITGNGLEKACVSRPGQLLHCIDANGRRAAIDVLCGTNHLYNQCLVESTAQTKLVKHTELEIQQQPEDMQDKASA